MKKVIYYILFFIFICLIGNVYIQRQLELQSPYSLSFASIGAISLESRLDCWAKLNTESTVTELRQEMKKILSCLQLPINTGSIQTKKEGIINTVQYNIAHKKAHYYICLKSDPVLKETHYVITVKSTAREFQARNIEEKLNGHPGLKWQYYFLRSGRLKEKIGTDSYLTVLSAILKKFKASDVKQYSQGQMMVVTAYSPVIGTDALDIGGSKCNLQAAVRTDEIEHKTYIYIGSPLIIADY
ncbi:YwmB family TATA-box binding protein [Syntrophomonas palmitatica]|uniref:YwmB family TATA-box binding protein n=1 Tax=Syntrophomonas palmitatica TaxID=402877 RepID=UPI0006D1385F|nr:YwmB family TATA-box binding protein [Syntrophomonas palmitatica]